MPPTLAAHGFMHWLTVHESGGVWLTALATCALVVGVVFARKALKDGEKTRHAQLVLELSGRWNSSAIVRARRRANVLQRDGLESLADELFGPGAKRPPKTASVDDLALLMKFPDLLEAIGVMTLDKAIPKRMVYQMWGPVIISAADQWELASKVLQDNDDPSSHLYFQWLAERMREERDKPLMKWRPPLPDDEFWFGL